MNPVQMAQQIKHRLEQLAWPGGSEAAVFGTHGSVAVFAGAPTEEQIPPGFPWAMVGIDSGEMDPDDPGLIRQRFTVVCAAEVAGDRMGENAIIGGSATDIGRSAGRGVSEVASVARQAIESLTGADGAPIILSGVSTSSPAPMRGRHMAMEEVALEALCTSAPHYSAPQHLRFDNGRWKWAGAHCTERFDFYRFRLVRKQGRFPSADPSDGTTVYTGTAAQSSVVQASGFTYTVFADYNSRGATSVEGSSSPEVGSFRYA